MYIDLGIMGNIKFFFTKILIKETGNTVTVGDDFFERQRFVKKEILDSEQFRSPSRIYESDEKKFNHS